MRNTEKRNPATIHIDKMRTIDMVKVMNEENRKSVEAVDKILFDVAKAIDVAAETLKSGGRIFYIGCGTSGRLGVLDASECPPTFGVSSDRVVGIIAGGDKCLRSAAENEEDIGEFGIEDLKKYNPQSIDTVVGISAAGGAKYVISAIEYAKSIGCTTVGIACNEGTVLGKTADISIVADTGAEVITGSTRLKAGNAQKFILNMISTCAMIKQGYVYENLMINLKPSNIKLEQRVVRITTDISGVSPDEARRALEANDWNIRSAIEFLK